MVRHVVSPHVYLLSQSLLSCIKRTRDAQGRSNVLRPLQRRFKARKKPEGYTSTPTGLKRLKTQNTAFHVNANGKGTPSGVPQPIHKRKLILVKEEFDASSSGGAAGNRTPIHTKPRIRLYKLSTIRQALKCFGQLHKRRIRFELYLSSSQAVENLN